MKNKLLNKQKQIFPILITPSTTVLKNLDKWNPNFKYYWYLDLEKLIKMCNTMGTLYIF